MYTRAELAEEFGLHPDTITRFCRRGILPRPRQIPGAAPAHRFRYDGSHWYRLRDIARDLALRPTAQDLYDRYGPLPDDG